LIFERDFELGGRVRVFAGYTVRHQIRRDHLDAVEFAFRDDGVTVVGRDQPVEELVHHFYLDVCSLEHVSAIHFL